MAAKNLTGQTFGRLTVIGQRDSVDGRAMWAARCECGNEKTVAGRLLLSGTTRSCGCLRARHGHGRHGTERTRVYRIWNNMMNRCRNPNAEKFALYGGRGITVCERWTVFENFLADMGEPPDGCSIDRFPDMNGNYEPGNCRWATNAEQSTNRRDNRKITYNGVTRTLADWSRALGGCKELVSIRIGKGWSEERAVSTPVQHR